MPTETTPMFRQVDLSELMNEGVLAVANERFFWPLGLALTWDVDTYAVDDEHWCHNDRVHEAHQWTPLNTCAGTKLGGTASNLHVRQWEWEDGHRESIGVDPGDEVMKQRYERFEAWVTARAALMPEGEGKAALCVLDE